MKYGTSAKAGGFERVRDKRQFFWCDASEEYLTVANQRIKEFLRTSGMKIEDGKVSIDNPFHRLTFSKL